MTVKLGKVIRVNVRDAWPNEAIYFTPWLASPEGLELLQDALEMDLEVEATEQFIGPFKADIVAKRTDTPDEHWVLIENQLEKTDHRHLGQLLTYAAGLKAATIVWVAERFEEEHRAALDWLNSITSDEFEFYGLEIELWRIDASPPAPMFNVIAQPNEWSRDVKHSADAALSDFKQLQQRYWQGVRSLLLEKKSKVRPRKAHPQHWADYSLGRAGTWLTACVNSGKKTISVEFACRGPENKAWFDQLEAQKAVIEAELGHALSWRRLDGKKQCRIILFREETDPAAEADWPGQHAWMVEMLERFHSVFGPRARLLIGEASVEMAADIETVEAPEVD